MLTASTQSLSKITPHKDLDVLGEYKRTKDHHLLEHLFHVNDFKHTDKQFKVGIFDRKLQNPTEKRFQASFKKRLEKLMPKFGDEFKHFKLSFHELKKIQENKHLAAK